MNKNGKNYSQDMNNYRDKAVKFYLTTDTETFACLKLKKLEELKIGFEVSDDKRETPQTFVGLIIDFHTPAGYERILFSLGLCGNKIMQGKEINIDRVGKRIIGNVIKLYSLKDLGQYHKTTLKLAEYAPSGWDGQVWLSFALIGSRATFSGIVISPLKKGMKTLKYEVSESKKEENLTGFDNQSIKYFKNCIRLDTFKSRLEKLKQQYGR